MRSKELKTDLSCVDDDALERPFARIVKARVPFTRAVRWLAEAGSVMQDLCAKGRGLEPDRQFRFLVRVCYSDLDDEMFFEFRDEGLWRLGEGSKF
jgi:hypothetical protein